MGLIEVDLEEIEGMSIEELCRAEGGIWEMACRMSEKGDYGSMKALLVIKGIIDREIEKREKQAKNGQRT